MTKPCLPGSTLGRNGPRPALFDKENWEFTSMNPLAILAKAQETALCTLDSLRGIGNTNVYRTTPPTEQRSADVRLLQIHERKFKQKAKNPSLLPF